MGQILKTLAITGVLRKLPTGAIAKIMEMDSWDESKHPRRKDGKFAKGSGSSNSPENKKSKSNINGTSAATGKTLQQIAKGFSKERRIFDKRTGQNYASAAGDEVELSQEKYEVKDGKRTEIRTKTGSVYIPQNTEDTAMVVMLPSGSGNLNSFDSTPNTILTNGRIALNQRSANNNPRANVEDILENEIAILGGIRQDGIYWRVTKNPEEEKIIREGKIRASVNHDTGEKEDGLSVWERPKYFGVHMLRVEGDVIGIGSDGEPLLDVKSVKMAPKLTKTVQQMETEGRELFKKKYKWTDRQLDSALKGEFSNPRKNPV